MEKTIHRHHRVPWPVGRIVEKWRKRSGGEGDICPTSHVVSNQIARKSFFSPKNRGVPARFTTGFALSGRAPSSGRLMGVCPVPSLVQPSAGRMRGCLPAYLVDVQVIEAESPATGPRATSGSSGGGGGLNPCEAGPVTRGYPSAKIPRLLDRIWGDYLIFVYPVRGDCLRCRFQGLLSHPRLSVEFRSPASPRPAAGAPSSGWLGAPPSQGG